jgi:hypothetical protein
MKMAPEFRDDAPDHVRFRFGYPSHEVIKPLVDVVNVEVATFTKPLHPCAFWVSPKETNEFVASQPSLRR